MISETQPPQMEIWRRAEVAHYRMQNSMYFSERLDLPWASLLFAEDIEDPDWNHAALLDLDPAAPDGVFDLRLAELREYFRARDRPFTLAPGPSSHPALRQVPWRQLGFACGFRHTWHFAHPSPVAAADPSEAQIAPIQEVEKMRAFLDVFESVYRVDLETGKPATLATGYSQALLRSFGQRHKDLEVVHYLATVGDRPAGIGTSVHGMVGEIRGISGLYNLAVDAGFRRRGLAGALVRRRVADARALGQEIIFLQTERESVKQKFPRYGFQRGFETEGWTQV